MDTSNSKTNSNASSMNSSSSNSASCSMDIKTPKKCTREPKLSSSRSRSFLHCISKHLGRHFHHHHQHSSSSNGDGMYNSQDDIRSSSTDSFSLSGSHIECHLTGSNIDLTSGGEEHTSRASSVSACSRYSPAFSRLNGEELELDDYRQQHIFVEDLYQQQQRRPKRSCSSDDDDDENEENDAHRNAAQQRNSTTNSSNTTSNSSKGLHLSRISITTSMSRVLQHFSNSTSMRSLSCSSTPLRRAALETKAKSKGNQKAASFAATSNNVSASASSKKKEKKQQSILRPPVHYVYMKGMSGLYSRVPRYTVCCPYAMQQVS